MLLFVVVWSEEKEGILKKSRNKTLSWIGILINSSVNAAKERNRFLTCSSLLIDLLIDGCHTVTPNSRIDCTRAK